jgi:hypothetical protein
VSTGFKCCKLVGESKWLLEQMYWNLFRNACRVESAVLIENYSWFPRHVALLGATLGIDAYNEASLRTLATNARER